jgi:ketosteroid isomerase-like protein
MEDRHEPEVMNADDTVAAYAAAWAAGDPERAWTFYADDVIMRLPGRSDLAGEHRGRASVIAAIQALLARTGDGTAEVQVLDRLSSADRVALVLREVVTRDTARLEIRRVNVYRVDRGRIAEIDIFEADQYAVDDFFR